MMLLRHGFELLLFVVIAGGPLPFCLWLSRCEIERGELGRAERLVVTLLTWCQVQTVVALLLGVLHLFTWGAAVAVEAAVAATGAMLLRSQLVPSRASEGVALRAARPPLVVLTVAAASIVGVTLLWWTAAVPIQDWDSWAFHLPTMAQWIQSASFTRQDQFLHDIKTAYPYGWEALCALVLLPFGEDFLVTAPNLVAWVLLGAATHLLGREFGAKPLHALALAVWLMVLPAIVTPINSMHVDVPFAAVFVAGAFFAMAYHRTRATRSLGLFVVSLGLLAGIRATGPEYAVLLLAFLLLLRGLGRPAAAPSSARQREGISSVLGWVCVGSAIFVGVFWYARNWIELGNPLGYVRIELGGMTLFPGTVTSSRILGESLAASFEPLRLSAWKDLVVRVRGDLGATFVVLPMLAAAWPAGVLLRARFRSVETAVAPPLLLVGTAALLALTPFSADGAIQLRYGFAFVAVLSALAAASATALRLRVEVPVAVALVAAALVVADSKILPLALGGLVGWGIWRGWKHLRPRRRLASAVAMCLLAAVIVGATFAARERRDRKRHEFYGAFYDYLESHAGETDAVGHLLTSRSYLLYGRNLRREVIHAPLGQMSSVQQWFEEIRSKGIRFVAIGSDAAEKRVRDTVERLQEPRGPLVPLVGGYIRLYRVDESWKARGG